MERAHDEMKLFKIMIAVLLIIFIFTGSSLFYAFKIEPYRLEVNEYTLTEKIEEQEPIKIVQFSDVHIKENFTYENLHKVVLAINEQAPDIVVFTGDLYDNYATYNDDEKVIEELQNIDAKYKKIAIWGNRDYGGGAVRQYANIMNQAGFTLLTNENLYVTIDTSKKILFTGLDNSMLGNVYMDESSKSEYSNYDILLSHEPDSMSTFFDYRYNLILSGHSHGGQVDIPFLPMINEIAVSKTSFATNYVGGLYSLDSNQNENLYVNTGIGTTHISARFNVVPEISVFTIYIS